MKSLARVAFRSLLLFSLCLGCLGFLRATSREAGASTSVARGSAAAAVIPSPSRIAGVSMTVQFNMYGKLGTSTGFNSGVRAYTHGMLLNRSNPQVSILSFNEICELEWYTLWND